jgi:anti-sigma-K factor RskA
MVTENKRQEEYRAHLEEMAAAYALGALDDPAERTYFEDLIAARDPLALELLGQMFDVSSILAQTGPMYDAPASVEESLLKKLHHTPTSPEKPVPPPQQPKAGGIGGPLADKAPVAAERRAYVPMKLKPYIIGGTALLVMLVIAFSVRLLNQRGPDAETIAHLNQLTRQRDSLVAVITGRHHADSITQAVFRMLQERGARMVTLVKSQEKDTRQHLFFSPQQKMVVFMDEDLPAPPPNKTYQLWQIAEGKTMSVGTIDKSKDVDMYDFPAPHEKAEGFAVTLEDSGGSPEPKGPILFAGAVPQQGRQ